MLLEQRRGAKVASGIGRTHLKSVRNFFLILGGKLGLVAAAGRASFKV